MDVSLSFVVPQWSFFSRKTPWKLLGKPTIWGNTHLSHPKGQLLSGWFYGCLWYPFPGWGEYPHRWFCFLLVSISRPERTVHLKENKGLSKRKGFVFDFLTPERIHGSKIRSIDSLTNQHGKRVPRIKTLSSNPMLHVAEHLCGKRWRNRCIFRRMVLVEFPLLTYVLTWWESH